MKKTLADYILDFQKQSAIGSLFVREKCSDNTSIKYDGAYHVQEISDLANNLFNPTGIGVKYKYSAWMGNKTVVSFLQDLGIFPEDNVKEILKNESDSFIMFFNDEKDFILMKMGD